MALSLGELANALGAVVHGSSDCEIRRVASLRNAGPGDISFLANAHYREQLAVTRASAVILAPRFRDDCPVSALVVDNPYAVYARAAQLLHPAAPVSPGIAPSAHVDDGAVVSDSASIGANAVIGGGALIGDRVEIGPGCVVEGDTEIGADTHLIANVVVRQGSRIGQCVLIHPGVVIGSDGFGFANDQGKWIKIPQLGRVVIGDDVEIGSNTTIDRGALDDTVIEHGVKLDNQIQIAHNVHIGAHTAIAGCTGIAGSTRIGRCCAIGGGVGIVGHIEIVDEVQITAMTLVAQSITERGSYSSGTPMEETRSWRKNYVRLKQLDDMAKRLQELESLVRDRLARNENE